MKVVLVTVLLLFGGVFAVEDGEEGEGEEPSRVLILTEENFGEVVDSHPVILVEFYAPW